MVKKWISAAAMAAILALPVVGVNLAQACDLNPAGTACGDPRGEYLTGDFHNHTPFSDGTASVPLLIGHAMQNLDWFAQSGHGGAYSRDSRYSDPEYDGSGSGEGKFLDETVGAAVFKGNPAPSDGYKDQMATPTRACGDGSPSSHISIPITWQNSVALHKPIWAALEWEVPGHEHCSSGIIDGQFPRNGKMGTPMP